MFKATPSGIAGALVFRGLVRLFAVLAGLLATAFLLVLLQRILNERIGENKLCRNHCIEGNGHNRLFPLVNLVALELDAGLVRRNDFSTKTLPASDRHRRFD